MRELAFLKKLLDGAAVKWKRLGDVARIKNGKDHKSLGDGEFPVYGSGGIMRYANAHAYNKPSVLIPRKGLWVIYSLSMSHIELRQKQYEHYRNLLLNFPKPEEVAA